MIEGAFSFTVLMMLLFGIMEFGRAIFAFNQLAYLAQEGARYASLHGSTASTVATTTSIANYVTSKAIGITPTTTTTWQTNQNVPGHWVIVKVTFSMQFVGPYMPGPFLLSSSAKDTILQ
jgi:Flp pilus assembly protein TadG